MIKVKKLISILVLTIIITLNYSGNNKTISINREYYKGQRVLNAADYLIKKSNMESIQLYKDGIKREMFMFNHSENNNINEYIDYRYIGNDVNNYVYFNCSNTNDLKTCELWRIIGVFVVSNIDGTKHYQLKIMSDKSIGNYSWNDDTTKWDKSSIYKYLNKGDFWYSLKGKAQNMIDNVNFKTGYITSLNSNANDIYYKEKEELVLSKVGLANVSDYIYTYALDIDNNCFNDISNCNNKQSSWMYKGKDYWLLNAKDSNNIYAVNDNVSLNNYDKSLDVYPTVYLKSNIGIESGNGSLGDAYVLSELKKSKYQNEEDMIIDDSDIKKEVYIDDTSNFISKLLIVISFIIIGGGLILFVIILIKSRKEIK